MIRSNVVLPEPEGPSKAISSPGSIDRLTVFKTACPPKVFEMPTRSMLWAAEATVLPLSEDDPRMSSTWGGAVLSSAMAS